MARNTVALLLAFLPLLALASQHPPHLRHRRHFERVRQVQANELDGRALHPEQINVAHAGAHRVIKREVAKRGDSCKPRQLVSSAPAETTTSSSSSTSATTTATDDVVAAAMITSPTTSSSSVNAQDAWAHGVSELYRGIMRYSYGNTDRPHRPRGLSPALPILGPLPPLPVPVACSLSPTSKYR